MVKVYRGTSLFWTPSGQLSVLIEGSVLISEVVCTLFYVDRTVYGVLIKGDVLISGVSL